MSESWTDSDAIEAAAEKEPKPITLVCGFPRSGTSAMMRMLHAGGMPLFCDNYQSCEHELTMQLPDRSAWIQNCAGMAVKILDPHVYTPPFGFVYNVVWMRRHPMEQAKSHVKLLRLAGLPVQPTPATLMKISESIRRDEPLCFKLFTELRARVLIVDFERLIEHTDDVATDLARFLHLRIGMMQQVIFKRSPQCLDGFAEPTLSAAYTNTVAKLRK